MVVIWKGNMLDAGNYLEWYDAEWWLQCGRVSCCIVGAVWKGKMLDVGNLEG